MTFFAMIIILGIITKVYCLIIKKVSRIPSHWKVSWKCPMILRLIGRKVSHVQLTLNLFIFLKISNKILTCILSKKLIYFWNLTEILDNLSFLWRIRKYFKLWFGQLLCQILCKLQGQLIRWICLQWIRKVINVQVAANLQICQCQVIIIQILFQKPISLELFLASTSIGNFYSI